MPLPRIARRARSVAMGAAGGITASIALCLGACERSRPAGQSAAGGAPTTDSLSAAPTHSAAAVSHWNDTLAGPELFVIGSNSGEAAVVLPRYTDSTLADAPITDSLLRHHPLVDLFARRGSVGRATLSPGADGSFAGSCTSWPTAHLATPGGPPGDWSVGFAAGHAMTLPMDSIATVSPPDSARRAVAIAHAASALPNDTATAFRGVPFAVRDAHAFTLPSGDTVIAAEVVRRLNQEANPQEEHLLIVLERDTIPGRGGARPPYVTAYSERTSGPEDDVETDEVLAAVLLGRAPHQTPAIVVGRDYGDGSSYTVLQRVGRRRWRARWSSAYVGC